MAYKVFTNGSVLNASEINENLMQQSTAVFSNSAARTAAITSPVEGQVTYLADTDLYQFWNGSAWANLVRPGLDFITAQTFTGVASASFGSNASPIFSSAYDNYRISVTYKVSTDVDRTIALRLRANTTDLTSAAYRVFNQGYMANNTLINDFTATGTSSTLVSNAFYSGGLLPIEFDLFYPFTTNGSKFLSGTNVSSTSSTNFGQRISSLINSATSYNGFTLLNSSGNFVDGTVVVYGYRKA